MKECFEEAFVRLISFETKDVITTSGGESTKQDLPEQEI